MRSHLSNQDRNKLAKVLALLGSDKPGERDAAALAATRLVQRAELTWNQILKPQPIEKSLPQLGVWRGTCAALMERASELNAWERRFISGLPGFRRLSVKQRYILDEIAARVLGEDDVHAA